MSDSGTTPHLYGGRYAIERKIARGGMADVFLSRDQLLDRPVALKVLFPELSVDPSFVERFRREAQNAARLSHPNIVSVYDWGEDDNAYFIVMEYVSGRTLSTMLRDDGPLPVNRAALIGAEVASALSFAHKNGVVHRDVKPGNVLIDDRGLVKVTDFGIARARNTTENLTQTGAVMGTATYFSPEQAQGFSVDQRSDVYSLGVVLYEIVAGKPPFHGDNPVTIAYKHVREDPQPLQAVAAGAPAGYAAIVAKALAKAPSDRYASAEDLRSDLTRFSNNQPVHALQSPPAAYAAPRAAAAYADATRAVPTVRAASNPTPAPRRKSAWGPFLVLISLLAAIAIGVVIFLNWDGTSENSPVTIPSLVGKSKTDAHQILEEAELRWTERQQADAAPKDTVIGQNPEGESQGRKNDIVQLTLSAGPEPITLDNYTNQSESSARNALGKAGLKVQTTQASSETVQQGNIISQQPSPGEQVAKGDTITLTISSGPQKIEVPNVVGYTIATASQTLSNEGLRTSFPDGTDPSDIVALINPGAGTQVEKGTTIVLTPAVSGTTTTTSRNSTTTTTESD
jgi:beta-lactam-binding protein with PASTA domain/predicted Ser/Thr protein kinase